MNSLSNLQLILLARGYKSLEEDSRCKAAEAAGLLMKAETRAKVLEEKVRVRVTCRKKEEACELSAPVALVYALLSSRVCLCVRVGFCLNTQHDRGNRLISAPRSQWVYQNENIS